MGQAIRVSGHAGWMYTYLYAVLPSRSLPIDLGEREYGCKSLLVARR